MKFREIFEGVARAIEVLTGAALLLLLVIAVVMMPFVLIDVLTSEKIATIEVECYDRYSNVIEGLVCTEDIYCGSVEKWFTKGDCHGGRE